MSPNDASDDVAADVFVRCADSPFGYGIRDSQIDLMISVPHQQHLCRGYAAHGNLPRCIPGAERNRLTGKQRVVVGFVSGRSHIIDSRDEVERVEAASCCHGKSLASETASTACSGAGAGAHYEAASGHPKTMAD